MDKIEIEYDLIFGARPKVDSKIDQGWENTIVENKYSRAVLTSRGVYTFGVNYVGVHFEPYGEF